MSAEIVLFLVGVPLIAGAMSLFMPDKLKGLTKFMSLAVTFAAFIGAIYLFLYKPVFYPNQAVAIFSIDNLSAFIGIAIAFFALLISIYSSSFIDGNFGRYFGYVLISLGASFGAAFANDLVVLLVFWGILAVTLYMLISMGSTISASRAAKKALIIVGGTDALMLFGIALIWGATGSFAMNKIHLALTNPTHVAALLCLAMAAFAKAGVMPLHSWLPDAAENAPIPATAYLPASLDKLLGIYLLIRISSSIFVVNKIYNDTLLIIGAVTIIFAATMALVQNNFKRLLGYQAVSQVGYMVIGIGTASPIGLAGALFHMLNHAIYECCLFLTGGNVEKKTGTANLDKLGGLAKYMPISFVCFLVGALSISGIPPLNGFVSKWMIYQGIIECASSKNPIWIFCLVCAMFGSALTIANLMRMVHAIFLGRPSRDFSIGKEAPVSMLLPAVVLAAICVIFGIFAFVLPLPVFIIPSLGISLAYIGIWKPVVATILILIGISIGLVAYRVVKPFKMRTVESFVGGEDAESMERISGTDFYNTVKEMKGLNAFYGSEASAPLDIYTIARKVIYFFTGILQRLHNGILPTYLVWCILGMLVMFLVLFTR